jgi:hypothetical protein
MPGFVWTIVGALIAALVIGLGFQSAFLGVIALALAGITLEIVQRLARRRSAARLVKWELESSLIRIKRLRDVDPTLTGDYLLPTTEWTKQRTALVHSRSFDTIVTAYREVDRVNDQWSWRKDIAKGGLIGANIQKDGLDTLEAATRSAIQALSRLVP